MDGRLLRAFLVVAEELHFGRAARRLHLAQPSLSAQIMRLEADLGTTLLERAHRAVSLTAAGRLLVKRGASVIAETERVRTEIARLGAGLTGTLAIAFTPTATYRMLPALLPRLERACPDLELDLREMSSPMQVEALRDGRIEVGLVCLPLEAPDLVVTTLLVEGSIVALPARHRLAGRSALRATDLVDEAFVALHPDLEPAWAAECDRALRTAGVSTRIVQRTDSKVALLGLVAAGRGIAVVSESTTCLRRDGVVFLPLTGVRARLGLGVAHAAAPDARVRQLVELATAAAAALTPGQATARRGRARRPRTEPRRATRRRRRRGTSAPTTTAPARRSGR